MPWAGGMWARAQKTINRLGMTEEHAEALARWMGGQITWKTPVTLDMLTKNLETWLAKAHGYGTAKAPGARAPAQFTRKWEED